MITEAAKLTAEVDRWIRTGWMSFNCYRTELYNSHTSSLDLYLRMVESEVVETLLYGCAMRTSRKDDY